jgi:hypothetical protein
VHLRVSFGVLLTIPEVSTWVLELRALIWESHPQLPCGADLCPSVPKPLAQT